MAIQFFTFVFSCLFIAQLSAQTVLNGSVSGDPAGNNRLIQAYHWTAHQYSPDLCSVDFPSYQANSTVTPVPSPDGGTWLGLAALNDTKSECAQTTITGLVPGNYYLLSFYGANFGSGSTRFDEEDANPTIELGNRKKTFRFLLGSFWREDTLYFRATATTIDLRIYHLAPQGESFYSYASLDGFRVRDLLLATEVNDFRAQCKEGIVQLSWSEMEDCIVEHSQDGLHFEPIASSTAFTRVGEQFFYEHRNRNGQGYYRLKWEENKYSKVEAVSCHQAPNLELYPNPTGQQLYLTGDLPAVNTYMIIDARGQLVQEGQLQDEEISVVNLPSGLYYLLLDKGQIKKSFVKA